MRQDGPGYFYVIPKRGNDWEIWMWTGNTWYEPGVAEARDQPVRCHRVPQPPRLDDTDHYHVHLDGYGDKDSGDVISKDGEVLGSWVLDPEGHPGFIPLGETKQVIWSPWVGDFCKLVKEWHEQREARTQNGEPDS